MIDQWDLLILYAMYRVLHRAYERNAFCTSRAETFWFAGNFRGRFPAFARAVHRQEGAVWHGVPT